MYSLLAFKHIYLYIYICVERALLITNLWFLLIIEPALYVQLAYIQTYIFYHHYYYVSHHFVLYVHVTHSPTQDYAHIFLFHDLLTVTCIINNNNGCLLDSIFFNNGMQSAVIYKFEICLCIKAIFITYICMF